MSITAKPRRNKEGIWLLAEREKSHFRNDLPGFGPSSRPQSSLQKSQGRVRTNREYENAEGSTMRESFIPSLLLIGLVVQPASGQRRVVAEPPLNQLSVCTKASQVTSDILNCLADANERDDATLNLTYRHIMQRLGATQQTKLRALERRWLVNRRHNCKNEAGSYSTGSWWPVMFGSCINDSTNMRIAWLQRNYR